MAKTLKMRGGEGEEEKVERGKGGEQKGGKRRRTDTSRLLSDCLEV